MKSVSLKHRIARMRMLLLLLVVMVGMIAVPQMALSMEPAEQEGEVTDMVTGTFDGLDLKEKRIWISDMVYLLDGTVKVKGTSVKLGLITDLKQGETIKAYLRENEADAYVPYVTLIERQ